MEEIPEDVREKAAEIAIQIDRECVFGEGDYGMHHDIAVTIVARAILAERERCAKVADTIDTDEAKQDHGDFVDGAGWASQLIAQRIREPTHDH